MLASSRGRLPVSYTHLDVYKRQAERLDHLPHKGILSQHLLAHPVGQAIKGFRAGFYRFCCGGRLCGFAAQQAVLAQALGQLCLLYTSRCV